MTTYQASWIVPISGPPIQEGWVAVEAGRIVGVGGGVPPLAASGNVPGVVRFGDAAVLPALVNAHTHLELSWLRGAVPPGKNFVDWVSAQMLRRMSAAGAAGENAVRASMAAALSEMSASGTGAVGDISNSLAGLDLLELSGLAGVVFHEIFKFNVRDPAAFVARAVERIGAARVGPSWRVALAPHAPYSVSAGTFEAIRAVREPGREMPTSVHIGESPEEMELLATRGGRWRTFLGAAGAWNPAWKAPRCGPVEYLDRLGFWDSRCLAVHGVQLSDAELERLALHDATLVTCPRSNAWVGVGVPPLDRFFVSGVRVALGTDSLASVPDLNLFTELAEVRRIATQATDGQLLACATINGATALGLNHEYGTIESGKRAALITVDIPAGTTDVEQYLVSGIAPERVHWIPC